MPRGAVRPLLARQAPLRGRAQALADVVEVVALLGSAGLGSGRLSSGGRVTGGSPPVAGERVLQGEGLAAGATAAVSGSVRGRHVLQQLRGGAEAAQTHHAEDLRTVREQPVSVGG